MKTLYTLGCCALLSLSAASFAQVDEKEFDRGPARPNVADSEASGQITMSRPSYGGTGCPQGSVIAVLSPEKTTLSLIFQEFFLEAGPDSRQTRKSCAIQLPFQVPPGMRATVVALDYRGYNYIPEGGQAKYQARYHFEVAGLPGRRGGMTIRNRTLHGPEDAAYYLSSEIRQRRHWSQCGQDFVLHIDNNVRLQTNAQADPALSTIDSLDAVGRESVAADTSVKYHLVWNRCSEGEDEHPGRGRGRGRN